MRVAVIGGGAAGQIAAIKAAENGHRVTIFEQNEKLGKKLFITGKGRCNVTNAADREGFFRHVVRNPRFLYSAYAHFDSAAIMALIEAAGVPLKVERGQRVFPASDHSSDILKALEKTVRVSGVSVRLNTRVSAILTSGGAVSGVRVGETVEPFDAIILATGGLSYPSTGSTGDGFRFAQALGHTVVPPKGSLVPFETAEPWCAELSGLTLKNVTLTAYNKKGKEVYSELGEMLFTHFGVSGPLVLSASALVAEEPEGTVLSIDLKPGLSEEQLDARLLRDLAANAKKTFAGALYGLLPQKLLGVVLETAGIDGAAQAGNCTKAQRRALIETLKGLKLHVTGARPIAEAIVTRGGVSVSEVNPSTMESKKVANLYFAGELLDTDAFTGGFNLQIAWSTGALAGSSIPTEVSS
ncbi:MAG: NAD(P)/FAD-dependent oxidoreductase, partial [Clostridia bacterium]|nr:NAD(P)/FAD-dependent oxidoreductase [Clostridia bacterium]